MLSADGATKNSLAQSDYMSNAFSYMGSDFPSQGLNIDYESFFPTATGSNGQLSPLSKFRTQGQGETNGQAVMYEDFKPDMGMNSNATFYSNMQNYQQHMLGSSKPIQYHGHGQSTLTDFEALQQKISQKKQSLDILQGIIPDPLVFDAASHEKRYITSTERIQVPSSDHVAEIVGKNGQRIKQLREELKVWVKTPSRDEPPIFEVTGLPEKLAEAKSTILRMSEHFTKVQLERQHRVEPNRLEDRLYVEQDKVGLIVGASGQTIRWVQQLSDTHIATPRKQESIPGLPPPQTYFTISGASEKVRFAKQLICEYVTLRCQGLWLDPELEPSLEASRLVREFHQRRQVEDNSRMRENQENGPDQRNQGAAGNGCAAPAGASASAIRPVVGNGNLGAMESHMFGMAPPRHQQQLPTSAAGGYQSHQLSNVRQLISEMEELWSKAPASSAAPPTEHMAPPAAWNSMLYQQAAGGMGDRRYSAVDVSSTDHAGFGGYHQHQQQQQMQQMLPPMPSQLHQQLASQQSSYGQQPAAGLGLGQQQQLIKKSHSDEQVSSSPVIGPGWM